MDLVTITCHFNNYEIKNKIFVQYSIYIPKIQFWIYKEQKNLTLPYGGVDKEEKIIGFSL